MTQTTILAFDVGIKNLSYCLIRDKEIIDWNLVNIADDPSIKNNNLTLISPILFKILQDKFEQEHIDYVVIENQPVLKNPTMKSIQMLIYSYFTYLKYIEEKTITGIHFIGAGTKVKLAEKILKEKDIAFEKQGAKYKYNKDISKLCVSELLKDKAELLSFYSGHKKKDDLADCYLLALVHSYRL